MRRVGPQATLRATIFEGGGVDTGPVVETERGRLYLERFGHFLSLPGIPVRAPRGGPFAKLGDVPQSTAAELDPWRGGIARNQLPPEPRRDPDEGGDPVDPDHDRITSRERRRDIGGTGNR